MGAVKINCDGDMPVDERVAGNGGVAWDNTNFLGALLEAITLLHNISHFSKLIQFVKNGLYYKKEGVYPRD
jgi:hypothetical protein